MPSQDAFYMLPDSISVFILSKIPLKDVVKCYILSRRWRLLYSQMTTLSFSPGDVVGRDFQSVDPVTMSKAENIITSIWLLHSRNLEALSITADYCQMSFSYENLCKWVRYAASCNVQHLTLYRSLHYYSLKELPPPALFSCLRLQTLSLTGYALANFPINAVGFPQLTSCELLDVQLTNENLASLISLCLLLQNLEITGDSELGDVVMFSSSIECLKMYGVKTLSVNCPKLRTLSVYSIEGLCVNGVRFYEVSESICWLEMLSGDTLRKLSIFGERLIISASRFIDIVGNFQSLEELDMDLPNLFVREEERDTHTPLLNLLCRLPNLRSLSTSGSFLEDLERDSIPECLAFPHVNLKKIQLHCFRLVDEEVALISCLLQSTPSLERMKIQLLPCGDTDYKNQCMFFKDILYLRRASSLARIIVKF